MYLFRYQVITIAELCSIILIILLVSRHYLKFLISNLTKILKLHLDG
jgi:hypothetical protein